MLMLMRVLQFAVALWVGAATASAATDCSDNLAGYVQPEIPSSDTVIVFVHGLAGSPAATWKADDAPLSWACLLRQEGPFKGANVYLFGYDTAGLGDAPSIHKVAERALRRLLPVIERHDQVIVVAHSMGGLVIARTVQAMLSDQAQRSLATRIKLVTYFGTPGTGSALARLARSLGVVPSVPLAELAGGPVIDDIVKAWVQSPRLLAKGRCFAEGRTMGGLFRSAVAKVAGWLGFDQGLVVTHSSAAALCNGQAVPIDSMDHVSMVKPPDTQHLAHAELMVVAQRCARPARSGGVDTSLAGTPRAAAAAVWRARLAQLPHDATTADREKHLARFIAPANSALKEPYIVREDPDHDHSAYRIGLLNQSNLMQWLKAQPITSAAQQQYAIALVVHADQIIFDGAVRARIHRLRNSGLLQDNDLVVVVDDPASNRDGLMVLFLRANARLGQVGGDAALKGLLPIRSADGCSPGI